MTIAQDDTTHQYTVRLDNFWVTYPRSKYTDTVMEEMAVMVRNPATLYWETAFWDCRYVTAR